MDKCLKEKFFLFRRLSNKFCKRQKRPQQRCERCAETFGPLTEAFRPEDHLRPQERTISHIYTKRDGRLDGTENLCAKPCVALIKTS